MLKASRKLKEQARESNGRYAPDTRGATNIPEPAPQATKQAEDPTVTAMRTAPKGSPLNSAYKAYLKHKDANSGSATLTWFWERGFRVTPRAAQILDELDEVELGELKETAERAVLEAFGPKALQGFQLINELKGKVTCTYDADNYSESNRWSVGVSRGDSGLHFFNTSTGCSTTLRDYHVAYYAFRESKMVDTLYSPEEKALVKEFFHAWLAPSAIPKPMH